MHVLVTGASGFVGGALFQCLRHSDGVQPIAGLRVASECFASSEQRVFGDLAQMSLDHRALVGVDVLVHAAARVHVMRETETDSLAAFRRINVFGTLQLARAAADAGVKRFVYVSSIKVNGEESLLGAPFCADSDPQPVDAYGISKWEAEQALRQFCDSTGMEWVVVRPPLVYGPGVKGNFQRLMSSLARGVPLPLGALYATRSLVALDNLVDLLVLCLRHPRAANQVFLASDGQDLAVVELATRLKALLGSKSWLMPVPIPLLHSSLSLLGRSALAQRLCGELRVDIRKTFELLSWQPPVNVDMALARTVEHFMQEESC